MSQRIVVQRSVHAAAQRLQKKAEAVSGCKAHYVAEKKMEECKAAGDNAGQKFWRNVYLYLLSREALEGEVSVVED